MTTIEVTLNELSFSDASTTSLIQNEFVDGLIEILQQKPSIAFLNIDALYTITHNTDCYSIILNTLSRDQKEQFLQAVGKCPSGWQGGINWRSEGLVEITTSGRISTGFAMAATRKTSLAGVPSAPEWCNEIIEGQKSKMDDSGEISTGGVELVHWFDGPTATTFHSRRRKSVRTSDSDSDQLWNDRHDLYPNIIFLNSCGKYLKALDAKNWKQVRDRLDELEISAENWTTPGKRPSWSSLVTPESATRQDLCWFTDDQGIRNLYEWHARFTPGAGRIHFRMIDSEMKLEIAYIGEKLGI